VAPAPQEEEPCVSLGNPNKNFTCVGGRFASYAIPDALARAYGPLGSNPRVGYATTDPRPFGSSSNLAGAEGNSGP